MSCSRRNVPSWVAALLLSGGALVTSACGAGAVPDPHAAVVAYAQAVERGDDSALYAMLSEEARERRTRDDVKRLLATDRGELVEHAKALAAKDARTDASARLRWDDGEEATLDLRDGRFRVATAGALPGGARSPEEALDQLRRVLARRSYAGLLRILSPQTRAALELELRTLVRGLEHPETLPVQQSGDAATVVVPSGHQVKLRKEYGVWRVDDLE